MRQPPRSGRLSALPGLWRRGPQPDVKSGGAASALPPLGREFRFYALGQAVSVVGDRVALITLVFLVIHLSHSYAPALALFYVCRVLPSLIAGLLVGVFVDHFDRRKLMIGCDLGRAVLMAVTPAVAALNLATTYPLVIALYALTMVFTNSARAALPDVVPTGRMLSANAILTGIQNSADIAYGIGGALLLVLGYHVPFYIDAGTFVFSAAMIALMRVPAQEHGPLPNPRETVARIRAGFEYVRTHPFLRWSTLAFAIAPAAGGAAYVIAPLYAQHALSHSSGLFGPLRSGAFRFSALEVCLGLGSLGGSAMVGGMAKRWPRGRIFGAGLLGTGIADAGLAFTENITSRVR